jgi:hypothetical protein
LWQQFRLILQQYAPFTQQYGFAATESCETKTNPSTTVVTVAILAIIVFSFSQYGVK